MNGTKTDLGRVLVTGGGGFLGTGIVRLLRDRGLAVRSLSRKHHPHLQELGVEQVQGDVADAKSSPRRRGMRHGLSHRGQGRLMGARARISTRQRAGDDERG